MQKKYIYNKIKSYRTVQRTVGPSIHFMLFCDLFVSTAAASAQNEDPPTHTFLVGAVMLLDFHIPYLNS